MKDRFQPRRGSALLIVLGMLSFMIVSAVAFSVYMRMSRAPSSFLRRNIATRHLVKAALARAIEDIDDKVGNDPYPGYGDNATQLRNYTAFDQWKYSGYEDTWVHRVFCPYANNNGDTSVTKTQKNANGGNAGTSSNTIGYDDTAAVLTLEGLGYIPPPLVNQARYWSRRTATARWHRFNYDLGRWAYVALNVSDLFDVNTMCAYTNRTSGAYGRVTLAPLVEAASGQKGSALKTFDQRVRTPQTESRVPLVSMMDWNLTFGNAALGTLRAPFYDWVKNGGNNGFYGGTDYKKIEPLLFVTDSWYPSTNSFMKTKADDNYYLTDKDDQPFTSFNNSQGMLEFFKNSYGGTGDSMEIFKSQLRAVGVACLYDYLDEDSVPISLAIPTVEQAPMIVGAAPIINGLQLRLQAGNVDENAQTGEKTTHYKCMGLAGTLGAQTGAIFPFKRLSGTRQPKSFRAQVMMKLFFAASDLQMRLSNEAFHPKEADWNKGGQAWYADSVITLVSQPSSISDIPNANDFANHGDSQDALVQIPMITFGGVNSIAGIDSVDFLTTYEREEQKDANGNTTAAAIAKRIETVNFCPFDKNGTLGVWNATDQKFNVDNFTMQAAVWVRILNSDGDTVDLAPATLTDDNLNYSVGLTQSQADSVAGSVCGTGTPIFNFRCAMQEYPYSVGTLPLSGAGEKAYVVQSPADWFAVYCYDPRYNFAPEDWYAVKDGGMGVDVNTWYNNMKGLLGDDGRDPDVFMFVSNQEWLQSVGELAFLPHVQDIDSDGTGGGVLTGNFFDSGRYNGGSWENRVGYNLGNAANRAFFWRTYRAYAQDNYNADPIYDLKDSAGKRLLDDDGRGPRVNPYTDETYVFQAVIKNTPYDYWAASVGVNTRTKVNTRAEQEIKPTNAKDYSFGEDCSLAKISDEEFEKIADLVKAAVRKNTNGDWLSGFNSLDWYGKDPDESDWAQCFLQDAKNLNNTALNSVDRKFLYSFWRSCFGNRQQLFLVFVRAEPSVLGGAQQGGRAVALVWRDPASPSWNGASGTHPSRSYDRHQASRDTGILPPHRTRILFYHQLED